MFNLNLKNKLCTMKHIKSTLSVFVFLFCINNLNAQGFYIGASTGYAFGVNKQSGIVQNRDALVIDTLQVSYTKINYTDVPLSLGNGFSIGGIAGYMFNENIGVEIGASYLYGGKTKVSFNQESYGRDTNGVIYHLYSEGETNWYSRMTRVSSSLILSLNSEKFNPYAKFGIVLGFGSFYEDSEWKSPTSDGSGTTSTLKKKYSGGPSVGFATSMGIDYNLSEKLTIFGELNYLGMSYTPQKSEIIKLERNGVDELSSLYTSAKNIEYVDSIDSDEMYIWGMDVPSKKLKTSYPFSSLGLNFGVKFNL